MLVSSDATTWTERKVSFPRSSVDASPTAGDYCIFQYQGRFWQVYTRSRDTSTVMTAFGLNCSDDGLDWQSRAVVDCSAISGVQKVWAPEWFMDNGGNPHVYFAASTSASYDQATFYIYETHPLTSDLNGAWSSPAVMIGPSYIDPFMVYASGNYYLWAKNEASGQKVIEVYKSASPTGPFTAHRAGDWMGIGSGVEGPSVRLINGVWRVWVDRYNANTGMAYADQSSGDWTGVGSTSWSSLTGITAPFTARHGTPLIVA